MQIIDLKQMQQYYWTCSGGIGQGKETKNLNVVDVLIVQEQKLILNWPRPRE
jgi:hypothetical protein